MNSFKNVYGDCWYHVDILHHNTREVREVSLIEEFNSNKEGRLIVEVGSEDLVVDLACTSDTFYVL